LHRPQSFLSDFNNFVCYLSVYFNEINSWRKTRGIDFTPGDVEDFTVFTFWQMKNTSQNGWSINVTSMNYLCTILGNTSEYKTFFIPV
jgi:hypothetical protein